MKVGEEPFKTGARKGKMRPIYDWVVATKKVKEVVAYDGVFKSGKNKGKPKPVYKTKEKLIESTGVFPSENRIHVTLRNGSRRLIPAAEERLKSWHDMASVWAVENLWTLQEEGTKVIAEMTFYLPDDKVSRDTHNAKKLLLDSLEGVIHENDMWILDQTIDFHFDKKNPRVEIEFKIKE